MLGSLDLTLALKPKEYEKQLADLQLKLLGLQRRIVEQQVPVVIMFEGWDASGKGGAIKRLTEYIDPRGYRVWSIAAPTPEEKAHHYLWRFWTRLAARGEVAIFDRSWYGRVLVERVEKFATDAEWQRAYGEINCFEKMIVDDGAVLCKFWLEISEKEQGRRFEERSKDPYKSWKLTPDDWRNRKRHPKYMAAAEDMFPKTSTEYAPWTLVEAEDKKFARIKVVRTVVEAIAKRCGPAKEGGESRPWAWPREAANSVAWRGGPPPRRASRWGAWGRRLACRSSVAVAVPAAQRRRSKATGEARGPVRPPHRIRPEGAEEDRSPALSGRDTRGSHVDRQVLFGVLCRFVLPSYCLRGG